MTALLDQHDAMLRSTARWAVARRVADSFDEAHQFMRIALLHFAGEFKMTGIANYGRLPEWDNAMLVQALRFAVRHEFSRQRERDGRNGDLMDSEDDWTRLAAVEGQSDPEPPESALLDALEADYPALVSWARYGTDLPYAEAHGVKEGSAERRRFRETERLKAHPERIAA